MRESEKNAWVKLLTNNNTAPFIPKTNKFNSDHFQHKFVASFTKLLSLKGINLKLQESESKAMFAPELNTRDESFAFLPFTHATKGELGFVILGKSFIEETLHCLLGGSNKVEVLDQEKPLTALEKRTLTNINGPLQLSLREGLKGLLGIHDITIMPAWDLLQKEREIAQKKSYFVETFHFEGLKHSQIQILLTISLFS